MARAGALGRRTRSTGWAPAAIASVLLIASPAVAGSIALHPLVVVDAEGTEATTYQAIFVSEAIRLNIEPTDAESVDGFLATLPGHSCNAEPGCLGKLATATGSSEALFITIAPYSPQVLITATLVRPDGTVRQTESLRSVKRGKSRQDWVRSALRETLAKLDTSSSIIAPLVEAHPPLLPHPPVSDPVLPRSDGPITHPPATPVATPAPPPARPWQPTWKLPAGAVVGGMGLVGLAGGLWFESAAQATAAEYDRLAATGTPLAGSDELHRLQTLHTTALSQQNWGRATLIGGGVLTAVGAGLIAFELLAPRAPPGPVPSARLTVQISPRAVSLTLLLP